MLSAVRTGLGAAGRVSAVRQLYAWLNVLARCFAEPLHQANLANRSMEDATMARRLSPELRVLHGPFKGMRYPTPDAAGSALLPKILGSYERELHGLMSRILQTPYTDIVDIGCAEGYYAVGIGMHAGGAIVRAFDTDPAARALCRSLAEANGIGQRVQVSGLCDQAALLKLPLGERALVISDCEGYEAQLFTTRVARRLAPHDVLIEVHDHADPALGTRLRDTFAKTHDHVVIDSIDDTRKLRSYHYAELDGLDALSRRQVLSEGRGMVMEWLFFASRSSTPARAFSMATIA